MSKSSVANSDNAARDRYLFDPTVGETLSIDLFQLTFIRENHAFQLFAVVKRAISQNFQCRWERDLSQPRVYESSTVICVFKVFVVSYKLFQPFVQDGRSK